MTNHAKNRPAPPAVMTIAGSDCSAGAGLQADLKTFQHFGLHGLTAVTCIVSETANIVRRVDPVDPAMVEDQIRLMLAAFPLTVVKTGMLGSAEHVRRVAAVFREHPHISLVVDPVMIASTGASLLEPDAIEIYRNELLPLATVNPLFPALRSGHPLFQRPSPQKQIPSINMESRRPPFRSPSQNAPLPSDIVSGAAGSVLISWPSGKRTPVFDFR